MDDRTRRELEDVVARAIAEDVGTGDLTSQATVAPELRTRATMLQKQAGVLYGLDAAQLVFTTLDPSAAIERLAPEGRWSEGGPVLVVEGFAQAVLAAERTALNLVQQLSGVATQTARYVREIEGTGARVLDTRKTTPGLRMLEKAAVVAGGGVNHRIGLWDQMLIKNNHIAMAGGVAQATRRAREAHPQVPLEVECRTVEEIDAALGAGAVRLLLDNMSPDELRGAVAHVAGRATLEASGGITLQTIRAAASTGVDWVSVGALTHSAPALDLSLKLEPLP
ncbi:MAG TPA: carboxylating nicotinate-nucleotide diphosphorylase [Solirubrobacteraceae bacterium]